VSESPSRRNPLAARVPFVADALQIEELVGLSEDDVRARLDEEGPNEPLHSFCVNCFTA